jgi:hypothetical protein
MQIHNPSALEDIKQALNVLAENQRREHLKNVLANDFVIELNKRYQEFKKRCPKRSSRGNGTVLNGFIVKIWLVLRFMKQRRTMILTYTYQHYKICYNYSLHMIIKTMQNIYLYLFSC